MKRETEMLSRSVASETQKIGRYWDAIGRNMQKVGVASSLV